MLLLISWCIFVLNFQVLRKKIRMMRTAFSFTCRAAAVYLSLLLRAVNTQKGVVRVPGTAKNQLKRTYLRIIAGLTLLLFHYPYVLLFGYYFQMGKIGIHKIAYFKTLKKERGRK